MPKYEIRHETDWSGRIRHNERDWEELRLPSSILRIVSSTSLTNALELARSIYGHHVVVNEVIPHSTESVAL